MVIKQIKQIKNKKQKQKRRKLKDNYFLTRKHELVVFFLNTTYQYKLLDKP